MDTTPDLRGHTLLDLSGQGPSARCVRALADLGMRWIRLMPPSKAERPKTGWFATGAYRGAEPMELDLKSPSGREVFLRLIRKSDVVVEGFRPGVADRLGIGYKDASAANGRIVYAAISGYGVDGPYVNQVGHDINYQATGGAMAAAGRRADGGPALPGLTFADSAGGAWHAAMLILSALVARQATGRGKFIDVSVAEGLIHLASHVTDMYLATGEQTAADNAIWTGRYAWYDVYGCADGKWLAVGAIEPKFFANLCRALEAPQFVSRQRDDAAQRDMRAAFKAAFARKDRAGWLRDLAHAECCVSPVLSLEELVHDPHWNARGMFEEYEHPDHGRQKQVRALGRQDAGRGAAPAGGETRCSEVLQSMGFSSQEIRQLADTGIVR